MQTVAYLDCRSGLRGDMFLGALLNVGLSLDYLNDSLAALPIGGGRLIQESVSIHGVHGTRLKLEFPAPEGPASSLAAIEAMLRSSTLPDRACAIALTSLQCVADSYAAIQHSSAVPGQRADLLTRDLCVEVIGMAIGIEALGIAMLYASPLPLPTGHTRVGSDFVPNPAPVTLEMLRHVYAPWQPCSSQIELVTPGAAAVLATQGRFETPPLMIERVGYGHGDSALEESLRLYLGALYPAPVPSDRGAETDWVAVIESHIDNMSGELLGGLMDRLFALGAFDVSYTPMQMKKNRPATKITVICAPDQGEYLAMLLLRETSTLGVRIQQIQRLKAQRSQQRIATSLGEMLVKVKSLGGKVINATPEFEECQRIATAQGLPLARVYEVAQQAIQMLIIQAES